MLVTGLPIPIIANNFSLYYTVSKLKRRLDEREELKRVTSTEVLNTMKSIMNKVNPLDKIKGLNAMDKIKGLQQFNPVNKVKDLVTSNGKQNSGDNSSAHATPAVPRRTPSETQMLSRPLGYGAFRSDAPEESQIELPEVEAGTSGLPPVTTVQPRQRDF